jgi:hypothetical protein
MNAVMQSLNKWFHNNLLFLNYKKPIFFQFLTKNTNITEVNLTHDNMKICNPEHSKFLGLMINSRLSWQTHIDQMIPKLNTAAYAIRPLKQVLNIETLKIAYFAFAH